MDSGENPWWFLFWWGGCTLATLVVMLFALYDALAVVREERGKAGTARRIRRLMAEFAADGSHDLAKRPCAVV